VDWLELSYKVDDVAVCQVVGQWRERLAREHELTHGDPPDGQDRNLGSVCVPIELGEAKVPFQLKATSNPNIFIGKNGSFTFRIDAAASEGWALKVIFSGTRWLEGLQAAEALEFARSAADAFGWQERSNPLTEAATERVARCDLAADVAGFDLRQNDQDAWVKPRRGRVTHENITEPEESDFERADTGVFYERKSQVSGLYVCRGAGLECCAYNKPLQLEKSADHDKRRAEETRWRENGWDGQQPVTRIEFRFRSSVLREFHEDGTNYRDDAKLFFKKLNAVWAYATQKWCRLVDVESSTRRKRAQVDERWAAVQKVQFGRERQLPAERKRIRGGANVMQALGTVFSFTAGADTLPSLDDCPNDDGEVFVEPEQSRVLSSDERARWLAHFGSNLGRLFGETLPDELVRTFLLRMPDPQTVAEASKGKVDADEVRQRQEERAEQRALAYLASRWTSTLARFAEAEPGPAAVMGKAA